MQKVKISAGAVATVAGLAVGAFAVAGPAGAAPTEPNAQETINNLQSEGYKVIVSRVGSSSMSDCTVAAVRPGNDVVKMQPRRNMAPRGGDGMAGRTQSVVKHTTVHVDVACH